MEFWCLKTRFFWNTQRFWHVLNLRFWYDVSPKSLHSLKSPRFWQAIQAMGFRCPKKNLLKYRKVSTGAKHKISIRCKPNIFVLFKNPKILTRKSRPWAFASKNMVLMISPKILTVAKPEISIRWRPKIFALLKNLKILTSHTGNGGLVSKTWFLRNTPRFRQVLKMEC